MTLFGVYWNIDSLLFEIKYVEPPEPVIEKLSLRQLEPNAKLPTTRESTLWKEEGSLFVKTSVLVLSNVNTAFYLFRRISRIRSRCLSSGAALYAYSSKQ